MSADHSRDDLALWPRIRRAIYAATVSRPEVMLHVPTCHRRNCPGHGSDNMDLVFSMFTDAIAESVHTELLCESVSDPDDGSENSEPASPSYDPKDFRRIVSAELASHAASERLTRAVHTARSHGCPWSYIAVALGTTVPEARRMYGSGNESAGRVSSFGPRPRISTRQPQEIRQ